MSMFGGRKEVVIFDTEYTAWEGSMERRWGGPGEYKEIVQIGAVIISAEDLKEQRNLVLYVKPEKNSELSDYFTNLTGIVQEDVDTKGVSFESAMRSFHKWCGAQDLYSFGTDGAVMRENAALLGVGFPFADERFHDIRELFHEHGVPTEGYMSSTIPRAFGIEPRFTGHDALNDARCIVDALVELKRRGLASS